jgi:hypothetical protein
MKTKRTVTQIRPLLLFLLFAPLLFSNGIAADRDEDVATTILSLERSKFAAQQQKDIVALDILLDDAFMWVDPNGAALTKAAYLAAVHDDRQTSPRIAPQSMMVKVFAPVAIVVGIYNETGLESGRVVHLRCRFIDTWTWKRGKWVCIAATASPATP